MFTFTIGRYLPLQFKYMAYLMGFTGLVFLISGSAGRGSGLLFAAVLIYYIYMSTQYKIDIDTGNKSYLDYLWFLGFKKGERQSFESIEKVYMTASRVSQTMHQRSITHHLEGMECNGFLKFSNGDKVHLGGSTNAHKLKGRLQKLAQSLNTDFEDFTSD